MASTTRSVQQKIYPEEIKDLQVNIRGFCHFSHRLVDLCFTVAPEKLHSAVSKMLLDVPTELSSVADPDHLLADCSFMATWPVWLWKKFTIRFVITLPAYVHPELQQSTEPESVLYKLKKQYSELYKKVDGALDLYSTSAQGPKLKAVLIEFLKGHSFEQATGKTLEKATSQKQEEKRAPCKCSIGGDIIPPGDCLARGGQCNPPWEDGKPPA